MVGDGSLRESSCLVPRSAKTCRVFASHKDETRLIPTSAPYSLVHSPSHDLTATFFNSRKITSTNSFHSLLDIETITYLKLNRLLQPSCR